MKRRAFHITLSLLIICTVFAYGKEDLRATTSYDLNNGSIDIVTNGSDIDIKQNGITIDTISPSETIAITSSVATTNNNLEIDITGISEEVTIKMTNVNIDVTGSKLAAVDITGTGSIRFEYEGTNSFKSDAKIGADMANGFSTKASDGINLTFAGSGTTTFTGYNCGVYLNKGGLIIESGTISAISKYPTPDLMGMGIYGLTASLTINGGDIYAQGNTNGIYADRTITINGGTIEAVGNVNRGLYAVSNLVINGGVLDAIGPSIGIQANVATTNYTRINGGTVTAKAQNTSNDWVLTADNLTVNGGSILGRFPSNITPKNTNGDRVYLTTLTLENSIQSLITNLKIDGIDGVTSNATGLAYGINDVYSDASGNLYFYLSEADDKQITVYDETPSRYQNTFDRVNDNTNTATLFMDKTITFHYQDSDGNQSAIYNVGYGNTFSEENPTFTNPSGYIFDAWYSSSTGNVEFDFDQTITSNQDVYAQYTPINLELVAPLLPDAVEGQYYSVTLPKAIGGVPTITYEVTNLPEGLTFNPNTLEITGTPVSSGEFTITYIATDSHTTAQKVSVNTTLKVLDSTEPKDNIKPPVTDNEDNTTDNGSNDDGSTITPPVKDNDSSTSNDDSDTTIIGKPSTSVTSNTNTNNSAISPTTGDTTNQTQLFIMLGAAVAILAAYGFYRMKRKNK
ncbi:putative Ig domain-containing protein [Breznakia pachnodae]|uniref:Repeat protein (TIGR02543 family) n=1 Tax=Breznakia pachnodae TaxID=265178 RepID=A0ABU0E4K8_9FIRM|nr:putative Ig domain-containing protein [Breznakia pachnodae]MDQ0361846.1 putative repeat protein (TIGR02543 family) [Breznakia pachnodae]